MKKEPEKVIGALKVMDDLNLKPNYSELERLYGVDRHTIKKYHESGCIPTRKKRKRISKWDPLLDEILVLSEIPGVNKMGIYQYLCYQHPDDIPGDYNSFRAYASRKNITCKKTDSVPHVLYETEPGEQVQVDWKENMKTHTRNGTLLEYNVFSATLGYSREHIFIYSVGKTECDFIRCVIELFKRIGGKTKILKTDNMPAIVSVQENKKKIHPHIEAFFKDLDVKLELCKIRTPETKGKCESANRFVNWIKAFDYQVEDEAELIQIIESHITSQCNKKINQSTNMPPAILFSKEKEYLTPLGNTRLLETYMQVHKRQEVPNTLLINFSGSRYSVPKEYIGKVVDIYSVGSEIYVYHNSKLITIHKLSKCKTINYKPEHYKDALHKRLGTNSDDIEIIAEKNLNKLSKLGGDQ